MIGGYSPELECACYRNGWADQLKNISSEALIELVKDYLLKHSREKLTPINLYLRPNDDEIFKVAGAADVLRERHGQNYISRITGVRPPKTLKEKFIHFFTGKMFPAEKQLELF